MVSTGWVWVTAPPELLRVINDVVGYWKISGEEISLP